MPVHGKNGLAGILLAVDPTEPGSARPDTAKSKPAMDFGAALGNLISAIAPSQLPPGQGATSANSGAQPPGTVNAQDSATSTGAAARLTNYDPGFGSFAPAGPIDTAAIPIGPPDENVQAVGANDDTFRASDADPADTRGLIEARAIPEGVQAAPAADIGAVSLTIVRPTASVKPSDAATRAKHDGAAPVSNESLSAPIVDTAASERHPSMSAENSAILNHGEVTVRTADESSDAVSHGANSSVIQTGARDYTQFAGCSDGAFRQQTAPPPSSHGEAPNMSSSPSRNIYILKAQTPRADASRERAADHHEAGIPGVSADIAQNAFMGRDPMAHSPTAASIRPMQESAPPAHNVRVANLTVEIGEGNSAQATVRERSGAVEIKIVAATAPSAQRISNEVNGLRRALDSAGLRLTHAEVSYQRPQGQSRRDHDASPRGSNPKAATTAEIFTFNEVNG